MILLCLTLILAPPPLEKPSSDWLPLANKCSEQNVGDTPIATITHVVSALVDTHKSSQLTEPTKIKMASVSL